MDLESLNNKYNNMKKHLHQMKNAFTTTESQIQELADEREKVLTKLEELKNTSDSRDEAKIREYNGKVVEINERIKVKQKVIELDKVMLQAAKREIEILINQLQQNPEMKKYINQALIQRYAKNNEMLEDKKTTVANKKAKLEIIETVISSNPNILEKVKEIISASKRMEESDNENGKEEYYNGLETIIQDITKTNPEIKAEDIEKAVHYITEEKAKIENGKVDFSKKIEEYNGLIEEYNQGISDNTTAIQNVQKELRENRTEEEEQNKPTKAYATALIPVGKGETKWYQFIKRFKDYRAWLESPVAKQYREEYEAYKSGNGIFKHMKINNGLSARRYMLFRYNNPEINDTFISYEKLEKMEQMYNNEGNKKQEETEKTNEKQSFIESLKYEIVNDAIEKKQDELKGKTLQESKDER